MKPFKKVNQYDIEKQNNKLVALERRLQYLINEHVALKEQFNKAMAEYKESCDILEIKEKEKGDPPKNKLGSVVRTRELEKQKRALLIKLETFKNEHISIRQTLDEYENRKKKLQEKYDKLLKENNELKNREEEIDYYINERLIEKKGLEDFLAEKIKEETQLRCFFDSEYKKMKEEQRKYVYPQKKFDLAISPGAFNNDVNNNQNFADFNNLSNVVGEDDPGEKKKDSVGKEGKNEIKGEEKNGINEKQNEQKINGFQENKDDEEKSIDLDIDEN